MRRLKFSTLPLLESVFNMQTRVTAQIFWHEESDPVKRAQMHEAMLNEACAICGKLNREHSLEDHRVCAGKKREEVMREWEAGGT